MKKLFQNIRLFLFPRTRLHKLLVALITPIALSILALLFWEDKTNRIKHISGAICLLIVIGIFVYIDTVLPKKDPSVR